MGNKFTIGLIVFMLISIQPVKGSHTNLHIDFEQSTLEAVGFWENVSPTGASNIVHKDAAYQGTLGFKMFSDPTNTEPNSVVYYLGYPFEAVKFLAFAAYTTRDNPVVRLHIVDATGNQWFDLDLLRNSFIDWQDNNGFFYYNVRDTLVAEEWNRVVYNLTDVLATAFASSNSPFTEFIPETIETMEIYQDTAQTGGNSIQNCFDEILMSNEFIEVEENTDPGPCYTQPIIGGSSSSDNIRSSSSNAPSLPVNFNQIFATIPLLIFGLWKRYRIRP